MWPFKKSGSKPAPRVCVEEDRVWLSAGAKYRGVTREAGAEQMEGRDVLVVAHLPETAALLGSAMVDADRELDGLESATTPDRLVTRLAGRAQGSVVLATSSALVPGTASSSPERAIVVMVAERFPLRARDDAVLEFAAALGPQTKVTFHVSTEDLLLREFGGSGTASVLRTLGAGEDDSIDHPVVSKSIRRAQDKVARECPDEASVVQWLRRGEEHRSVGRPRA